MTLRWLFAPALVLLVCLSACDQNDVAAPFQVDAGTLTLYGYLDATRTVQRARIEPRRRSVDFPRSPEAALLEGTEVLSYRLGENEDGSPTDTVRWTQRAERLPDGTYAAVFSAFFQPLPLERYRVVTRRAGGPNGPAIESADEITVPSAGPPVDGAWRAEDGRVLFPVTWPVALNARLDTLEVEHTACLSFPPLVLDVPDTLGFVYVDTLLINGDSIIVYGDTVVVAGDTIIVDPSPILTYTRPFPSELVLATERVSAAVEEESGGFTVLADLKAARVALGAGRGTADIRYDRLRLTVRVRDADWTGSGGDPRAADTGFLGGANGGQSFHAPPPEAIRAAGMTPGAQNLRCQ